MKLRTILFALLAIIASGNMFARTSYKTWTDTNGTRWSFTVDDSNNATLCDEDNDDSWDCCISGTIPANLTVPSTVTSGGTTYRVTGIEQNAFKGCSTITSVAIPASVTFIGDYSVFDGCTNLANISVASGNTVYNDGGGKNCIIKTSSNELLYGAKNTIIPSTVTKIGTHAFKGRTGLTSITIPSSVTSIESAAFSGCTGLQSVTIEGAQYIKSSAFSGCTNLATVTIPATVKSLDSGAFRDCTNLTTVKISDIAAWYNIAFEDYDSNPLYYAHQLYLNNTKVTSLTIPSTVTEVKKYAFNGADFTSVTLSEGVTSIGMKAFQGCTSLTSVSIPSTVTSIGDYAFLDCSALTNITVASGNTSYNDGTNANGSNCIIETSSNKLIVGANNTTIPDGVETIGYMAFYGRTELTTITLPYSIRSDKEGGIDPTAFRNCSNLTSVYAEIRDLYIPDISTSSNPFEGISSSCKLYVPYSGNSSIKNSYTSRGWTTTIFKGGIEITPRKVEHLAVADIDAQPYTGSAIEPAITIRGIGGDASIILTSGTDYTVSYSNNIYAGTATATITGKGNYTGTREVNFTITARDASTLTISSIAAQTYNGSAKTPTVTVKNGTTTLTNGTDYTVSYSNNINAGTATVTITGKGNYTGTKTADFTINPKNASSLTISSIAAQTYTGSALTPTVTVKDGTTTLTRETDYTVSYSNNTDKGTATVTITGKGNYTGTKTTNFTINARNASGLTISSIAAQTYTGSALTPAPTVTDGTTTLTSGTDYTVSYSNNTNAGTATVTITGKGNYTGTKTANFTINPKNASSLTISSISTQTYNGSAHTPAVTVKDGTTTLTSGTDYTVSYSNNTNAGTATVTVTGIGNYTGTKTANFTISGRSASNFTISDIEDQTYNGSALMPAVTVKDGTTTLTSGTDYSVSYSNNTNVGTATVTITGKGNYTGTKTTNFTINAPDPTIYDEEAFAYINNFTYVKDLAGVQMGYKNGTRSDESNCSFINCTQRANHEGTIKANVFCVENFYGTEGKTNYHMYYYGDLPNKSGSRKGQFNFCMDWYGIGGSETSKFSFQNAYANMEIGQTATITGGYTVTILDKVTSENEAQRKLIFSVDHPLYFGGGTDGYPGINNFRNRVQIKYLPELDMALTDGVSFDNTENQSATTLTYTREFNNTNWQALYVPFALAYDDWSSDFEIATLKELVKDGNEVMLVVEKLGEGSKTTANTPYVIKVKSTGTKTLTPTSKVLFKAESNSKSLTTDDITLTFTGTYTVISGGDMLSNDYYALGGGTLHKAADASNNLSSFRWYLTTNANVGNVKMMLRGNDGTLIDLVPEGAADDAHSGAYDLSGRKVDADKLKRGIYIINGKKVLVK